VVATQELRPIVKRASVVPTYGLGKQTVERVFGIIKRVMGWSQITFNRTAVEPDE